MKLELRTGWKADQEKHVVVRAMSTFGRYWPASICVPDAVAVTVDGLLFTACRHRPDGKEREYYTEFDEFAGVEFQFLASMMLAVAHDEGLVAPYPDSESFRSDFDGDLADAEFQRLTGHALRDGLIAARRPPTAPSIPISEGEYDLHHRELEIARLERIFLAIDPANDLLIRGLYAFVKARMLAMHSQFVEEANYGLYIALDVLFSLIRQELRKRGIPNPTSYDAQALVHELFGEEQSGMRFFEDFYDDRVMTMHPDNRYGEFRHAPLSNCDFHTLFESIREVYRELILASDR